MSFAVTRADINLCSARTSYLNTDVARGAEAVQAKPDSAPIALFDTG